MKNPKQFLVRSCAKARHVLGFESQPSSKAVAFRAFLRLKSGWPALDSEEAQFITILRERMTYI